MNSNNNNTYEVESFTIDPRTLDCTIKWTGFTDTTIEPLTNLCQTTLDQVPTHVLKRARIAGMCGHLDSFIDAILLTRKRKDMRKKYRKRLKKARKIIASRNVRITELEEKLANANRTIKNQRVRTLKLGRELCDLEQKADDAHTDSASEIKQRDDMVRVKRESIGKLERQLEGYLTGYSPMASEPAMDTKSSNNDDDDDDEPTYTDDDDDDDDSLFSYLEDGDPATDAFAQAWGRFHGICPPLQNNTPNRAPAAVNPAIRPKETTPRNRVSPPAAKRSLDLGGFQVPQRTKQTARMSTGTTERRTARMSTNTYKPLRLTKCPNQ